MTAPPAVVVRSLVASWFVGLHTSPSCAAASYRKYVVGVFNLR